MMTTDLSREEEAELTRKGKTKEEEDEAVTMASPLEPGDPRLLRISQGKVVQTEVSSESLHKEQLGYPNNHTP